VRPLCLALGASLALPACSGDAPAEAELALGQARQGIIAGFGAESSLFDFTGSLLAVRRSTGARNSFCGAALIAPETAVTAKHCAEDLATLEAGGYDLFYGIGANGVAPDVSIPIAAFEVAPGRAGGFLGIGSDVAVVHLASPAGTAPARLAALDDSFLGVSLVTLGYGAFGGSGANDDQRRSGRETVAATSGNALEIMLGSFENFVQWRLTAQVSDADYLAEHEGDIELAARLPQLLRDYASPLLPEHEVVTGLAPGDTQMCRGDSGSPLSLLDDTGVWHVYGVASATLDSKRKSCDFGTVFATFGPETMPFLERALGWADPCGELGAVGSCDGAVARRCETVLASAVRRVVEEPCAEPPPLEPAP
jgi:hypothetical protein